MVIGLKGYFKLNYIPLRRFVDLYRGLQPHKKDNEIL